MALFHDPRPSAYIAGSETSLSASRVTRLKLPAVALLLRGRLAASRGLLEWSLGSTPGLVCYARQDSAGPYRPPLLGGCGIGLASLELRPRAVRPCRASLAAEAVLWIL